MDPKEFRNALGTFISGVTVLTTLTADGRAHGMTASAFSSLSMDPPLLLVCVQNSNKTCEFMKETDHFGISILTADQQHISNRFAGGIVGEDGAWTPWPEARDKFEDLEWEKGDVTGSPLVGGALVWFECAKHAELPGGDHTIFVGRIESATNHGTTAEPLVYFRGGYRSLETTP